MIVVGVSSDPPGHPAADCTLSAAGAEPAAGFLSRSREAPKKVLSGPEAEMTGAADVIARLGVPLQAEPALAEYCRRSGDSASDADFAARSAVSSTSLLKVYVEQSADSH